MSDAWCIYEEKGNCYNKDCIYYNDGCILYFDKPCRCIEFEEGK